MRVIVKLLAPLATATFLILGFQNCSSKFEVPITDNQNLASTTPTQTDQAPYVIKQEADKVYLLVYSIDQTPLKILLRSNCKTASCLRGSDFQDLRNSSQGHKTLSLIYDDEKGGSGVIVIDLKTASIVGDISNPTGNYPSYAMTVVYPADPSGNRYPVLTAGYSEFHSYPNGSEPGTYLCIFRPGLINDGCGKGFGRWDIRPRTISTGYEKHLGAFVFDADGDGWEDIFIPFFTTLMTVSGNSGQVLNELTYDVAKANSIYTNEPYNSLPAFFHSGRNYGVHSMARSGSSNFDFIIGGNPVGTFGTYSPQNGLTHPASDAYVTMCDVSRFVAAIESTPSVPTSQHLKWSRYFSFYQPIFDPSSDRTQATAPTPLKNADNVDRCVHFFGNGRVQAIEGGAFIGVNVFEAATTNNNCAQELWAYSLNAGQQNTGDAFARCLTQQIATAGKWTTRMLWQSDGSEILKLDSAYTWGRADNLAPSGGSFLIAEPLNAGANFDLSAISEGTMKVYQASSDGGWHWTFKGNLPVSGRPKLQTSAGNPGFPGDGGTAFGISNLTLKDIDGDGLNDIQLNSGTWIGYSRTQNEWVVKK